MTVGSMICDLDERRIHVCAGPPCENPYEVLTRWWSRGSAHA